MNAIHPEANADGAMGRRKAIPLVAGGGIFLFVVALLVGGWLVLDDDSPLNRASALRCVQEWARLAPVPKRATDVKIETQGSSFSREFILTFTASPTVVASWLTTSPGTQGVTPETQPGGTRLYRIQPGGGAVFAEVRVGADGSRVRVRVVWS